MDVTIIQSKTKKTDPTNGTGFDTKPLAQGASSTTDIAFPSAKIVQPLRAARLATAEPHIQPIHRDIAGETPISLTYNGLAYAVMMATPLDLEDFATGFSLTQNAVKQADEILSIDIEENPLGFVMRMQLLGERFSALTARRRNVVGQTGCGLCGIVELEKALLPLQPLPPAPFKLEKAQLFNALSVLRDNQPLHRATGAMHGAAFFEAQNLIAVREDVGRHNAFDKLIGCMARTGIEASRGFAVLTSRCSYELVEKAVIAQIPLLVTVSAPTTLAVQRAQDNGLALICLARADSVLVFNDPNGMIV